MPSYLVYLNFINLPVRESYTVNKCANPFDELDDDKFQECFHLTKAHPDCHTAAFWSELSLYYKF